MSTPFLPSTLPLLPLLPPQVLFPYLSITITLPQSHVSVILSSIAENARKQNMGQDGEGGRMIAVVPVIDIERRIGRWACAARIKRISKSTVSTTSSVSSPEEQEEVASTNESLSITLEGLARIRLPRSLPPVLGILPPAHLPISTYSLPLPSVPLAPSVDLLPYALKLLPPTLHTKLAMIPSGLLADMLSVILGFPWETRVELLGLVDPDERSRKVEEVLVGVMVNRGIKPPSPASGEGALRRIAPAEPESDSRRALVRRPAQSGSTAPPAPAQIPEDLQPLQALYDKRAPELTRAAHLVFKREFQRLTKIPAQSAEYGVSKTYLEWILALPWKRVSPMRDLRLEEARKKLDDEHEGLEKVKRRVVEFLAVWRLKRDLWEERRRKRDTQVSTAQTGADEETAKELLELIPKDERKALEEPDRATESGEDQERSGFRDKGPILLLVGPPGVGKTSIAKSLADCMGRKFHRISLGGVRDEAEIRGHRRTYVGALPGMLVQGLRKVGTANPLILLDELDKVGTSNFHGDPAAALLETLDPAQNHAFHDHYLGDLSIDLSQVMFIATANTLDTISPPLLDRCEVIECSGYTTDEKVRIAERFLLPKQIKEQGLDVDQVRLGQGVVEQVIMDYTREAGVRSLEREIGKLCRSKAVDYAASRDSASGSHTSTYIPEITLEDLEKMLGVAKFENEIREEMHRPGVITGLAYRGSGTGGILLIESTLVPGGKGRLVLTGSLGDVIKESAEIALTWVKSHAPELGLVERGQSLLQDHDLHLHLPSGGIKKDGPSAGVGMVLAIVSLLSGRSIPATIAVTGEVTLRGAVTAVGGIMEKVLGAHRAGISKVIIPSRNLKDVKADLPESTREQLAFAYISTISEALEVVWGPEVWKRVPLGRGRAEARL